jgi:hypothetical protein
MARTRPIGGTADVRVNDRSLLFRGEMTWNFQVFQKKGVAGRDGRMHGFTVDPNVPFIEGEFTHDGTLTTKELEAIVDATVSVALATGAQLVLRGAYVAGEVTPGADEGKVKIRFEGEAGEELKPQG